jgi:VanZ family protein
VESPPPSGTLELIGGRRSTVFRRIVGLIDRQSVRITLAALWTVLICVLCWTPRDGVPTEINGFHLSRLLHVDKLIHVTLFFGFSLLWYFALSGGRRWAIVLSGGLALALLTEYVQGLPIIGRTTDFWDLTADTAGAVLGIGLAMAWPTTVRREARVEFSE